MLSRKEGLRFTWQVTWARLLEEESGGKKRPPKIPCSMGTEGNPCRREQLTTPVFWPGEFHGLYSPWGHKESDMAERLSLSLGTWASRCFSSQKSPVCPGYLLTSPESGLPLGKVVGAAVPRAWFCSSLSSLPSANTQHILTHPSPAPPSGPEQTPLTPLKPHTAPCKLYLQHPLKRERGEEETKTKSRVIFTYSKDWRAALLNPMNHSCWARDLRNTRDDGFKG